MKKTLFITVSVVLLLFFLWRVPVREIEPNVFATPPESPQ